MGRSGYTDDCDSDWERIKWRGQVASAIRGKRGQAFLKELIEALDAMPEKRLIAEDLINQDNNVCALGAVGVKRNVELKKLDPYDHGYLAEIFGVAPQLVQEIEWVNDEQLWKTTPEQRWQAVREWAVKCLKS